MEEDQVRRLQSKKKLAAIVMGLIIIAVLAFAYYYTQADKEKLGNTVVLAVCTDVSAAQQAALADRLNQYAPPDEGRGSVVIELHSFPADYSDPQGAQLLKLIDTMNAGNPNLYIFDWKIYSLLADRVQLSDLSAYYPDNTQIEKGLFSLVESPFWMIAELENLSDCVLAIQRADSNAVTKDAQTLEYYKYQRALLDNIINEQPGEEPALFG